MPALLLHLSLAKDALRGAAALGELGRAASASHPAFLLGAILPDLPYHARFGRQLVRHLLQRAYLLSEWGDLLHHRGTGRLALALLRHLRRSHLPGEERDAVLAMLAGYLSHAAVDRVAHKVIDQLVAARLQPGEPPSVLHSRIERYQSLFFHLDRLGVDLAGSPLPRQMVSEVSGVSLCRPDFDQPLWEALRAACLETHGRIPPRREVRDWLWGIAAYGQLMSSPLGRTERLPDDRDRLRAELYQSESVDLQAPLDQSIVLTLEHWHAALCVLHADRLDHETRAAFLRRVPDVDLGTGY